MSFRFCQVHFRSSFYFLISGKFTVYFIKSAKNQTYLHFLISKYLLLFTLKPIGSTTMIKFFPPSRMLEYSNFVSDLFQVYLMAFDCTLHRQSLLHAPYYTRIWFLTYLVGSRCPMIIGHNTGAFSRYAHNLVPSRIGEYRISEL